MKSHHTQQPRGNSPNPSIGVDLQMNLLNTWTKHQVADYYQNVFLIHLDELPQEVVEERVRKEIKNTMLRKTYYYALEAMEKERNAVLNELQQQLSGTNREAGQEELQVVCERVKEVRDLNLRTAETIIKMSQDYQCRNEEATAKQMEEYSPLIDNLQKNVKFIKESYLTQYIRFGDGFDPFFMNNYEHYHRDNHHVKTPIKELYKISISTAYRLMKAKNTLLDMRSASSKPREERQKRKESYKFQALPTLHTQNFQQVPRYEDQSYVNKHFPIPIKISPIKIMQGKLNRSSRTTIHPQPREYRPQSSYTEQHSKPGLNAHKVFHNFQESGKVNRFKKNKIYLLTEQIDPRKSLRRKYELRPDDSLRGNSQDYIQRHRDIEQGYYRPIFKHNNIKSQRFQKDPPTSDLSKLKSILQLKSNREKAQPIRYTSPSNLVPSVKNYNPIKKQQFQISMTPNTSKKYDFNAHYHHHSQQITPQIYDDSRGINYEEPIYKYSTKNKPFPRHINAANYRQDNQRGTTNVDKTDREIQTTQQRQKSGTEKSEARKGVQNPTQGKNIQNPMKKQKKTKQEDDETIQDEDIVDERPLKQKVQQKQPLIRVANPSPPKQPKSPSPPKKTEPAQDKKEIKMKIGKSTIKQVLSLLQTSTIQPEYKALFDMQKLVQWLRVGQTYLIEFHVNDSCAIIALCSPIPNIGMALKLWAPISDQVNFALSNSLFTKYIQFIEKSTSVDKIMFSGNGQAFKELMNCDFQMKKEKLYERMRKLPPKKIESEFEPFLYVECSTVNFAQNGKENLLFSQEIEEFKPKNCYLAKFLGVIKSSTLPQPLKPMIKVTQKITNFTQVNKILQKQQFDQYQANDVKVTNITLLRLYFNSPLKTSFITNEGYIRLIGILLYEKDKESLIAVPTTKNNGTMYFSKNMSFESILQKSKNASNNKVAFSVKMFTKKLYGKLVNFPSGCYGNFEINLTWQDEMQGKIKHNLVGQRCFGTESFTIGVELQKTMLYCLTIDKDDYIF